MGYSHTIFWKNFDSTLSELTPINDSKFTQEEMLVIIAGVISPNDPLFISAANATLMPLEMLILTPDIKNNIQGKQISIYLLEPVGLYDINSDRLDYHDKQFYQEFPANYPISHIRAKELDSIEIFRTNNSIDTITVYTCDYHSQELQINYPNLNIVCYDMYIRTMVSYMSHLSDTKFIFFKKLPDTLKIEKKYKFFSANWRFTPHRHLIMSQLHSKSGIYSWAFDCGANDFHTYPWLDIKKIPRHQLKLLCNGVDTLKPHTIDIEHSGVGHGSFGSDILSYSTYPEKSRDGTHHFMMPGTECFCAVVTESRYGVMFPNISEKVLNAMNFKMPFILVGGPYSLHYMKELGFKTFDAWWDESYDTETDHTKRFVKILEVIEFIDKTPISELQEIYHEMHSVLQHNYDVRKQLSNDRTVL